MGSGLHPFVLISVAVVSTLVSSVAAATRENHFGNPCALCDCFVEYTDRDLGKLSTPYSVAKNPYDTTEDRCLATCMNDEDCKAVVYGFVGGRGIFTCELYGKVVNERHLYTPFTNIYVRRMTPCELQSDHIEPLELEEPDERIAARKDRYIKLARTWNPFSFGR